ncbi:unnamed protein product [Caenorhabditis sp. 36 PRJEB53466]|nr:unnamed protein product [Caenorhabditis sp. 36 PRJEB53466]
MSKRPRNDVSVDNVIAFKRVRQMKHTKFDGMCSTVRDFNKHTRLWKANASEKRAAATVKAEVIEPEIDAVEARKEAKKEAKGEPAN